MKQRINSNHSFLRNLLTAIIGFSLSILANQLFADIDDEIGAISLEDLLNIEISVASGKKALTTRESPGIVSVITAREIRNSGARDLIDILRLVPGIEFGVDVWGITSLSMRGNWAHEGKVLLMMDGQELNELAFSTNMLGSHYSVDQIQKIEIIRGPGSAIYGGFAELGVINIITKSGKDLNGFAGGINYGRLNKAVGRQQVHMSLGAETDTMGGSVLVFFSDGRRSDREYTDITGESYNMEDNSDIEPAMLNVAVNVGGFQARVIYDKYDITQRDFFGTNLSKDYENNSNHLLGELKYDFEVSDQFTVTPKFNYKRSEPWITPERGTDYDYDEVGYYVYDRTITRLTANVTGAYDLSEKTNILVGVEYYEDEAKINSGDDFSPFWDGSTKVEFDNTALYAQSIIQTDFVNMTIGGRFEEHNEFGSSFAPRIGFTKVYEKAHFKLLWSEAFRAPGLEDIEFNAFLSDDLEPDIKPEETQVFEFEAGYRLSENSFITANIFHITIKDTIVYFVIDGGGEGYKNVEQAGTKGFELEYKLVEQWGYITANYSYYTASGINKVPDYEVEGEDALIGSPQNKVSINSSFKIIRNLTINPSLTYLGKRYDYNVDGAVDSMVLVNLFLNYENALVPGLDIGIGVYDLLDEEYDFIQPYWGEHPALPGPGRELIMKLSYRFGL